MVTFRTRPGTAHRLGTDASPTNVKVTIGDALLRAAVTALPRSEYLRRTLIAVKEHFQVGTTELWLREAEGSTRCILTGENDPTFTLIRLAASSVRPPSGAPSSPETLATTLLAADLRGPTCFWRCAGDPTLRCAGTSLTPGWSFTNGPPSLAYLPLDFGDERVGVLGLLDERPDGIGAESATTLVGLASLVASALANQQVQAALRERVKELTCLYGISQVAAHLETPLDEVLQKVVDLLPPAWQYPDQAHARLTVASRVYLSGGFSEGQHRQSAPIVTEGGQLGSVEVHYVGSCADLDEEPFLAEERHLIDAISRHLALIIERRETAEARRRLEDQLRHADRLATIGQLAAGVAHELNEPLGNILGFAQLAAKDSALPEGVKDDLEKIVGASLFAREIVKKLMLFSRQTQPSKAPVDINRIIRQGLFFLEARSTRMGISLRRELETGLPQVTADPSQLHQVLVNLVVNALQATDEGGLVTIRTRRDHDSVIVEVQDTGCGMTDDMHSRIFLPFFTTKDVDQGTGLGLSVVHGIVTAHGGTIRVESSPGSGSRFAIELPVSGTRGETDEV